jgi:hypothetical protein
MSHRILIVDDETGIRQALKQADAAPLVLIVSRDVYRKVVESGLCEIRPEHFREVRVSIPAKEFDEPAYVHVPGYDMRTFWLPGDAVSAAPRPGGWR